MGTVQEAYRRWWEGKYCKFYPDDKFKYVQSVQWLGPPSGVYGIVIFHYLDGSESFVPHPHDKFRPRKKDVIVEGE